MDFKALLSGVIDMHVHTAPDLVKRTYTDLQLADAAVSVGARAIVIKGHHCGTMARAALCSEYVRKVYKESAFAMYGGLVLNREAGGLNPQAVETALELGAKVIWMPTVDAANEYRLRGKSGGISVYDENGSLLPALRSIFALIRDHRAVLATGHLGAEEIFCVTRAARDIGVEKIVITHPEYWIVNLTLEQQEDLVHDYDVILERCYRQPLSDGRWVSNAVRNLEAMRALGFENTILSTDCGNPANPPWEQAMGEYLQFMIDHGVPEQALRQMTQTLPAHLLDLLI